MVTSAKTPLLHRPQFLHLSVDMIFLYHPVHILLEFPFDNADTQLNLVFHLRYKRKSYRINQESVSKLDGLSLRQIPIQTPQNSHSFYPVYLATGLSFPTHNTFYHLKKYQAPLLTQHQCPYIYRRTYTRHQFWHNQIQKPIFFLYKRLSYIHCYSHRNYFHSTLLSCSLDNTFSMIQYNALLLLEEDSLQTSNSVLL